MALKVPKKLQQEWEKKLAAEGLSPLTAYAAGETRQRRKLTAMTASGERADVEAYYAKAEKFLRRIELAHAIWSLHCKGLGRREIAYRLGIPGRSAKKVRLVLQRLYGVSGLVPPSFGGED